MSLVGSKRRPYVLRDNEHAMVALDLIRTDRGVTFRQIGEAVAATRQQVSEWLRNGTMPAAERLFEMAHALGYGLVLEPKEDGRG